MEKLINCNKQMILKSSVKIYIPENKVRSLSCSDPYLSIHEIRTKNNFYKKVMKWSLFVNLWNQK